ncbi:MAG: S8 family serine peptidase [Candidatus Zixiibacteriota bacterium]
MRRFLFAAIILSLQLVVTDSARAGQLVTELSQLVSKTDADSLVRVWILLPRAESKTDLQAIAKAAGPDRATQHRVLFESLKSEGLARQQTLAGHLEQLQGIGKADKIKRHWITDVVEAEVAAGELNALADRDDVASIIPEPQVSLIRPVETGSSAAFSPEGNYIPNHITHIRADVAWGMGYTGAGRVICSFDNGVDGNHIALRNTWKGLDGDSSAAWFDPVAKQKAPHAFGLSALLPGSLVQHGTHTMGILVGRSDSVWCGVAPNAKWISAAVIDVIGASILDGFEWAVDPDGNPNTVEDVPDVISHSWGFSDADLACFDVFFDAIDNIEALGIVNIFAAGNDGLSGPGTINNPGNGANAVNDSLYAFAVGALDSSTASPVRYSISSQGPSTCQGATKPNVMAPGLGVYSTYPSGTYNYLSGTSMATPQVAGLVALLRQKNPNATVTEIKQAILKSTRRLDTWQPLPNNQYGWGEIDCAAALDSLSSTSAQTKVRLYDFTHAVIAPGDTVEGTVVLQNLGVQALNVSAAITGSDPSLTVLNGSAAFGTIPAGDTVRSANIIRVVVSDTVTTGSVLSLPLTISGSNFADVASQLSFLVGSRGFKSFVTHSTGRIQFTVSNYGVYGMGAGSIFPAGGQGFQFDGADNDLWEGGILAAYNNPTKGSAAVHDILFEPKMDYVVAPGGNLQFQQPGSKAPQQSYAAFVDDNAPSPLGLNVVQETYSFDAPDNTFIIVRYILRNVSVTTLTDLAFGLFLDWDITNFVRNSGKYEAADSILWMAYNGGTVSSPLYSSLRGLAHLDGPLYTAVTRRSTIVYSPWLLPPTADGFTSAERRSALYAGLTDSVKYRDSLLDLFQLMSAGPLNLAPGGVDTVAFAVIAGDSLVHIRDAATRARDKYRNVITDVEPPSDGTVPSSFTLYQNYPNPFNPSTKISFVLPRESDYTLRIYNLLGQVVDRIDGHARGGRVEIVWDAKDRATGLYLYRIEAGSYSASRKMLLLK